MTSIRELYNAAVTENQEPVLLLLDFLIFEKEVLTFECDPVELNLYFKANNKKRMNELLLKYKEEMMTEKIQ